MAATLVLDVDGCAVCPEARDSMGTWFHTLFIFTYFDN